MWGFWRVVWEGVHSEICRGFGSRSSISGVNWRFVRLIEISEGNRKGDLSKL